MRRKNSWWAVVIVGTAIACHPYGDALQGEFNAGAVDPFNFPPAYRGTGFTREVGGSGTISERTAFAHNAPANYFFFPFPPALVATTGYATPAATADPLRIVGPALAPPQAFEFDNPTPGAPATDSASCQAASGYQYDAFRDDVRYDRQGNLLSALPTATFGVGALPTWSYLPVVQRVGVTSKGEACQSVKNDQTVSTRSDVTVTLDPPASALYLAWAVIDPGSPVFRVGQTAANSTGISAQRFGWYRQFLVAYIDGGPIPTVAGTAGTAPVTRMGTQKLYFPRSGAPSNNGFGAGNDVVQFQRAEAGYSPVCQVFSYTLPAATPVPRDVAVIEAGAAASPTTWNVVAGAPVSATGAITPTLAFCLQAQ